jgi:hypothetical protein
VLAEHGRVLCPAKSLLLLRAMLCWQRRKAGTALLLGGASGLRLEH